MDLALNNLQKLICHKTQPTYQMLPLQARVDLEAMTMKWYSAFPKAPVLPKPHYQII